MDLSIIIALYNTEKYIKKCIESIYEKNNLKLSNFEVIVINDGSTDRSQDIVKDLQVKYNNLKLLNKENGGQSSARNLGFNISQGKYIFCLDSDDFVVSKELEKALLYCKQFDLDMLAIDLKKYDENYNALVSKRDNYSIIEKPIDGAVFLNSFVLYGSMCRYFYKKTIMTDNKLLLTEGIFHEDEEFVVKFISFCKKISYQKHSVYRQVVRLNSTTKSKDKKHRIKLLNDLTTIVLSLNDFSNSFDKRSMLYKGILKKNEQLLITLFLRLSKKEIDNDEKLSIIRILKANKLFPLKLKVSRLKFKAYACFMNLKWQNKLE